MLTGLPSPTSMTDRLLGGSVRGNVIFSYPGAFCPCFITAIENKLGLSLWHIIVKSLKTQVKGMVVKAARQKGQLIYKDSLIRKTPTVPQKEWKGWRENSSSTWTSVIITIQKKKTLELARFWKQPRCPSIEQHVAHLQTIKRKWQCEIHMEMDETWKESSGG